MGQVLELKQKISSDWTVVERLQLDTLVSCLPARLAEDVEFGVSDSGDPWCAVLNEDGEVVLHVARIDGRFYVHSTIEPFVAEARDLPTAVTPFVGDSFLQNRHVASITPMYGLVMPLHAYAPPSDLTAEPQAEMLDLQPDAVAAQADAPASELPEAPEPWAAPVFTLGATAEQPLAPVPEPAVEQVLFPIQDSDWPQSSELLDFSAPARIESIASLDLSDVTFAPFVLAEPPAAITMELSIAPEAPQAEDQVETTATDAPATTGGGNVISVDFGQPAAGAGFSAPSNGLAGLDGLQRAANSGEIVISDLAPGVVVGWSDPLPLAGVLPAVDGF